MILPTPSRAPAGPCAGRLREDDGVPERLANWQSPQGLEIESGASAPDVAPILFRQRPAEGRLPVWVAQVDLVEESQQPKLLQAVVELVAAASDLVREVVQRQIWASPLSLLVR